ncbi:7-dehydrocholesterol reductase [Actinomadura fulvescens]|uniref:7-dehydrocholesterol reductase n=1 Tax=Actinomadura fulvescens TaxID=46160 RepID=A0ABP6DD10_9ACTN
MLRDFVGPLVLLVLTPPSVIILWEACRYLDGSLRRLATLDGWAAVKAGVPSPSWSAAAVLLGFLLWEALLLRLLPGRLHRGPVTPDGARPEYRLNGVRAWLVTHAAFLGASYGLGWFSPGILYERFGELLITMCLGCLALCGLLYAKGRLRPSAADAGSGRNVVMDYFWGVELHPSVLGVDLKQLFNCRFGMMGWSLLVVSFAAYQHERLGHLTNALAVSVALQLVYILKFFVWERGYFSTLDMMHDRFGYYLCWGVTTWLPGVYTIAAQYLTAHPRQIPSWAAWTLLAVGLAAIGINYDADRQRQRTRDSGGTAMIWGRPAQVIQARYATGDGQSRQSLLLVSGWWGVARHFHYLPEMVLALAWSLPAGFGHLLPYVYPIFLGVLLVDRAGRDDRRCQDKYGAYWNEYRRRVRWRVVPRVY